MPLKKILILEDELITATEMAETLVEEGYEIIGPAMNYGSALKLFNASDPDLLLIDIQLKNDTADGIDFANYVREKSDAPIIFLTANSHKDTLLQIAEIPNASYMSKIIKMQDLIFNIFIKLTNSQPAITKKDYLMLYYDNSTKKVMFSDIVALVADESYTEFYLKNEINKKVVSGNLSKYLRLLSSSEFIRLGRSFVLNIRHIKEVKSDCLVMQSPGPTHSFIKGQKKKLLDRIQ
jgi:DNA-binding LytR/AlgR family response regulator